MAIVHRFDCTVKPDLTTTCEQQPPVNNGQFESSRTSINLSFIRHLCQTASFFWSRGLPLYTGLTVLKSNETFFFCNTEFPNPERTFAFDFSMPLVSFPRKIVTMRRPQEDFVGSAYLSVFTNQFWLVLTITTFVLSIMLFCFLKLEPKKENMLPSHSFSDAVCFTVLSLCCREIVAMKANCSGRILILIILCWGFLISCAYNAILTSSLAVSDVSPPIKSFRDLLESQDYNLVLKSSIDSRQTNHFKEAPENSTGKVFLRHSSFCFMSFWGPCFLPGQNIGVISIPVLILC